MIRLKHQRHAATFHLRVTLNLRNQEQLFLDLLEQITTQIQVRHFATLELQRELNFVSLFQEFARVIDLDHQIVVADAHGDVMGAADGLSQRLGLRQTTRDRANDEALRVEMEKVLSSSELAAAMSEGQRLTPETALELAGAEK